MNPEKEAESSLEMFKRWLETEETGGLSVAQTGALLALSVWRSGTPLGSYLHQVLQPGPDDGDSGRRQRGILPLPLLPDARAEMEKLFNEGEFRRLAGSWGAKKQNKEKAAKQIRRSGMLLWHGLVVTGINALWTGGGNSGKVHRGGPSKAQQMALARIWDVVRDFVDDRSETQEKVPRSPTLGEWGKKLGDVRISYQGEIVEKAHQLTLAQILPGLPPPGFGGSVPLVELCDGELREKLMNPEGNVLKEEEMPEDLPKPKVHASPEQWQLIAKELYTRGLVEPVESPLEIKGKPICNGAFGVVKPGKFLEDERPILRLIMDFRAVNAATRILEGDVRKLTGAPALQHIVLPNSSVLRVSAEDLVAAFYLFALPPGWSRMMCFGEKVPWTSLGISRPGSVYLGARVLPMGWASAVGVLQHAHRRLALRSPLSGGAGLLGACEIRRDAEFPDLELERSMWSLYLDDTTLVEILDKRVAKELEGKPSAEQKRLRRAYQHWGIPVSKEKALVRNEAAEKLGAVVDGEKGVLKGSTKRALENLSLGFWLLRQERVPRKALQVFLGKEVHTMQFRRPLFGVFDYLWKDVAQGSPMVELGLKSVEEVLLSGLLQPLRRTDLRARLHELVTASDASETGGGMVYGHKLSQQGLKEVLAIKEGWEEPPGEEVNVDGPQVVLAIDFFAGIGGLSRALQLADVKVAHLLVVENDPDCRRLNAVRWPGCDLMSDIQKVTKKELEKAIRGVPGLTGVIAGGGSPCQGLSQLSANRKHLEDPRSKLFYRLCEIFGWIADICGEMEVWNLNFLENVVGDEADVEEMTEELGAPPLRVCSSGLSRVRRPRLYWSNADLEDHSSYTRAHYALWDELCFEEELEPMEFFCDEGWLWAAGNQDEEKRLPTFTRAIPRSRPPVCPAGIDGCDEATLKRWKEDKMKYPPYTYKEDFLFESKKDSNKKRVASASERERLMGYPTGYTLGLFKKEPGSVFEMEQQEVARCAALGNSFHAVTVACLIDLWLWSAGVRTDPMGAKAIVERWHKEMSEKAFSDFGGLLLKEKQAMSSSLQELELEEEAMSQDGAPRNTEWLRMCGQGQAKDGPDPLSVRLIHQYLRRCEFRGSDIRLDLGVVYRPDAVKRTSIDPRRWLWRTAQAYRWSKREHINLLELRAVLRTLEWRSRSTAFHSCRFMHLSDSQIVLAVLTKGRSSSRRINRLLRKVASLCLCLNLYPLWAWISSRLNPADGPSRKYV